MRQRWNGRGGRSPRGSTASPAIAGPGIHGVSGVVAEGGTITIAGSGFGAKSTLRYLFDDFSGGVIGNRANGRATVLGAQTWVDTTSEDVYPLIAASNGHPSASRVTQHSFAATGGEGNYNVALEYDHGGQSLSAFFLSMDHRYLRSSASWTRNHKPFHLFAGDYISNAYIGFGDTNVADGQLRVETGADTIYSSASGDSWELSEANGNWIRYEANTNQGSGVWTTAVHNGSVIRDAISDSGVLFQSVWRYLRLGAYMAVDNPADATADVYLTNVYLSPTATRVEAGNASTYAACTKRAVQPESAWSDTEITVRCSLGLMASASEYTHLYVVGSGNQPIWSEGFAL